MTSWGYEITNALISVLIFFCYHIAGKFDWCKFCYTVDWEIFASDIFHVKNFCINNFVDWNGREIFLETAVCHNLNMCYSWLYFALKINFRILERLWKHFNHGNFAICDVCQNASEEHFVMDLNFVLNRRLTNNYSLQRVKIYCYTVIACKIIQIIPMCSLP